MRQLQHIDVLKPALDATTKALVIFSSTPNTDSVAASLGLALALEKKGINTQVVSLSDMRVEFSRLVGVDTVSKKMGNRNLVVSFDYLEDQVEKVSYTISEDGKRFNLVIAPKAGSKPLDPNTVQFDLSGVEADFVFYIGVSGPGELGSLYEENHLVLESAISVGLSLFPVPGFAKYHYDAQGLSSISELTALLTQSLRLDLDQDSSSNFLAGIDAATQGLSTSMASADTFELVAALLRAGGKRQPNVSGSMTQNQMPFMPSQPMPHPVSNDKFAQLLGSTQRQPFSPPQMPNEFKG